MNIDPTVRYWNQLLTLMEDEERRVVPVIGPGLLTIQGPKGEVRLYRHVAEKLLQSHGLTAAPETGNAAEGEIVLRRNVELSDAVGALVRSGERPQDLYVEIKPLIQNVLQAYPNGPESLSKLVSIPAFDLFVTTTCDDLLKRALVGYAPAEIPFAPNLPGDQIRDIPERRPANYRALFYMFGRLSAAPTYAIHEEDTLEFIYRLQTETKNVPTVMLSELRRRSLLFIGCALSEWLARFFIRFTNNDRLSGEHRSKGEFLAGADSDQTGDLTVFLERFSKNTRVFRGTASAFVDKLVDCWDQPTRALPRTEERSHTAGHEPASQVDLFISYSRTDLVAAQALFEELTELGFKMPWFDKSVLKPGDTWEHDIFVAIEQCAYFVPLISTNTEARDEGFFRKEWDAANERCKGIQGRSFIFPVVVDVEFDGNARRFERIPDRFLKAHFGHAPGGKMTATLRDVLEKAIRDLRRRPS